MATGRLAHSRCSAEAGCDHCLTPLPLDAGSPVCSKIPGGCEGPCGALPRVVVGRCRFSKPKSILPVTHACLLVWDTVFSVLSHPISNLYSHFRLQKTTTAGLSKQVALETRSHSPRKFDGREARVEWGGLCSWREWGSGTGHLASTGIPSHQKLFWSQNTSKQRPRICIFTQTLWVENFYSS